MARHKEGVVERYFVQRVNAAGGLTRKVQWVGRRGCPDQFFAFPARKVAIPREQGGSFTKPAVNGFAEIKAPGEKPDAHQAREIERLRAKGVPVVVLDCIDAVDQFVEQYS